MNNHPNRSRRESNPAANPQPTSVRAARVAAGLTQSEAGALVYRTARNWQQWESGERPMDPGLWLLFQIRTFNPSTFGDGPFGDEAVALDTTLRRLHRQGLTSAALVAIRHALVVARREGPSGAPASEGAVFTG